MSFRTHERLTNKEIVEARKLLLAMLKEKKKEEAEEMQEKIEKILMGLEKK